MPVYLCLFGLLRFLGVDVKKITTLEVNETIIFMAEGIQGKMNVGLSTGDCYVVDSRSLPLYYLLQTEIPGLQLVDDPKEAYFFIEAIQTDSNVARYTEQYPESIYFSVVADKDGPYLLPWESEEVTHADPVSSINSFLIATGNNDLIDSCCAEMFVSNFLNSTEGSTEEAEKFADGYIAVEPSHLPRDTIQNSGQIKFTSLNRTGLSPFWGHVQIDFMPDNVTLNNESIRYLVSLLSKRLTTPELMIDGLLKRMIKLGLQSFSIIIIYHEITLEGVSEESWIKTEHGMHL